MARRPAARRALPAGQTIRGASLPRPRAGGDARPLAAPPPPHSNRPGCPPPRSCRRVCAARSQPRQETGTKGKSRPRPSPSRPVTGAKLRAALRTDGTARSAALRYLRRGAPLPQHLAPGRGRTVTSTARRQSEAPRGSALANGRRPGAAVGAGGGAEPGPAAGASCRRCPCRALSVRASPCPCASWHRPGPPVSLPRGRTSRAKVARGAAVASVRRSGRLRSPHGCVSFGFLPRADAKPLGEAPLRPCGPRRRRLHLCRRLRALLRAAHLCARLYAEAALKPDAKQQL